MSPYEHLCMLINRAYFDAIETGDDRTYRALMAQRDVMIGYQDKRP